MIARMSTWNRLITDHPASVNETYGQHFAAAAGFGIKMIWGGIVCLVHAIIPGVFCTKASQMIEDLHERMITNRRRLAEERARCEELRRAA